ncbi:hypothetical protein K493DRAFT_411635 [Basidiobolus meristosporus CBS 931.73]|uniref:F-box domain-containing protein n=1 Tax=Basidiobolus meristosporus CBS 931.73 TaxID=1314790 RepID=A0A1Y1XDQ9_9FUNG|nr:hypothetical protein K493DRAFT_411635 [Basidiobolus meristosporus CBS 931.73]|eukprot:ORX83863.1 hypothetical protein K493DRAFT_411635 [Basidiobolus meristosporus CBS 931.73]
MTDINFQKAESQPRNLVYPSHSAKCLPIRSSAGGQGENAPFGGTNGIQLLNHNQGSPNKPQPNDSSCSNHDNHGSLSSNVHMQNHTWDKNNPTTPLISLPAEIVLLIFSFLSGQDIYRVCQVCKYFNELCQDDRLWRMMVCRRFGRHHLRTLGIGQKCKEVYKEKSVMRISIANGFARQGQGSNSFREYDEFSASGMVLCLNDFYGFYSKATLEGVPRGRYDVIWKIKVFHRSYMRNTLFVARVLGVPEEFELESGADRFVTLPNKSEEIEKGHFVELDPGISFFQRTAGIGWFDLVAPQQLVVDGSYCYADVGFEIVSDRDSWKTGLVLDYVQLRKAG